MNTVKFEHRKIITNTEKDGKQTWVLQSNPEIELGTIYIRYKSEIYFLR